MGEVFRVVRTVVAGLDDWAALMDIFEEFKTSRWAHRLDVTREVLETLVRANPLHAGVLITYRGFQPVGFACLWTVMMPVGATLYPRTFLQGIYGSPGVTRDEQDSMHCAILGWGRDRGHDAVFANVRLGARLAALEKRYGFTAWHTVIGRKTEV